TGNPIFGRRGMELWMYTPALPGFSAYRMLPGDVAGHGHGVFGIVTKMATQWSQILETFPRLTGIFLLAFFVPALFFRFVDPAANAIRRFAVAGLAALVFGGVLFRADMPLYMAMVPLMLVFAVACLLLLLQQAQASRSTAGMAATVLGLSVLTPLIQQT